MEKVEVKKATVRVNGKDYELRFTIGFWKIIQEKHQVTKANLQDKLNEDFGTIAASCVWYGIFYGLQDIADINKMPVSIEDIERQLDNSVVGPIEQAIINGMTKAEMKVVEMIREKHEQNIKEAEEQLGKKKLPLKSTTSKSKQR